MEQNLAEHFFRHEHSRLLATLCGRFGTQLFPELEDAVQMALLEAMTRWRTGVPDNPSGWLYRVAHNRVLDHLRHADAGRRVHEQLLLDEQICGDDAIAAQIDARGLDDDVLRLTFVVCHPELKPRDQIMLAMKHLCGLGAGEIARGLLMKPAAVRKQLQRAALRLKERELSFELPATGELGRRLDTVHRVLYMVFNEGYSCAAGEQVVRQDVCAEAARLCHLLAGHTLGTADTRALLALMMFHAARLPARVDEQGDTILLEQQDRSLWHRPVIDEARRWLHSAVNPSAPERPPGRYLLEACIAQMHCEAASFDATPWPAIVATYDALIQCYDSPVYRMNRAIAVAYQHGVGDALAELQKLDRQPTAVSQIGRLCTRAWLLNKAGDLRAALGAFETALQHDLAPHERRLIEAQCQRLNRAIDADPQRHG